MDIAGAKALKERIGPRAVEDPALPARDDVHEDAPPVYRWTGVGRAGSAVADRDDEPADPAAKSLRLRLGFRQQ
jgi:hypothetical protein